MENFNSKNSLYLPEINTVMEINYDKKDKQLNYVKQTVFICTTLSPHHIYRWLPRVVDFFIYF